MIDIQIDCPGQGNPNADIAIVGEFPVTEDKNSRKPFSGSSGYILNDLLKQAGISRQECWLTHVVKYQPPGNKIELVKDLDKHIEYLQNELKSVGPKVIIALGNTALKALTGKSGIDSWRGSILTSTFGIRTIPTYHPQYLLRTQNLIDKAVMEFDFRRAVEETSLAPLPARNLVVIRDSAQLYRYISRWDQSKPLACDIETHKAIPACIGFAPSPNLAISIPLFQELWGTRFTEYPIRDIAEMWRMIDKVLLNFPIIGQNFKFDEDKLTKLGFRIPNFHADTMLMAHTLYPELLKGLAFLTSIHTREPYYKLEGKEFNPKKDNSDQLFLYNAKDCAVEYEIYEVLNKELHDEGLAEFYYTYVNRLHKLYLKIEREGIKVDYEQRKFLFDKYNMLFQENQTALEVNCNREVNVMSPKQVSDLLYNQLGLPVRKGTGEEVLVALLANHSEKRPEIIPIIEGILRGRTIRKTIGTYINACPDYDGRHRTSYQIVGTETGRTSTKIYGPPIRPEPIGLAFQTITKHSSMGEDLFSMFVPDDGYVYLECDLSQAEARIVDLLAEDYEGLDEYGKIDKHSKTARIVLGLSESYVLTKKSPERFIGKTSRHAGSYDMGKRTAMLTINTDAKKYGVPVRVSEWKAGQILERFHRAYPKIKEVFHKEVQAALARNNRTLVNPFGRKRRFTQRWGDQLFKEAYAQIPQSTVGDVVKRAALYIVDRIPDIRICMEKHDALGFLIPKNEVREHAEVIKEGMELPIDFSQCSLPRGTLVIPCEFEIGEKNFYDLEDYKL